MSSIRDDISTVIELRIPPQGYKRYIYEVDRTGGFTRKTIMDMLIVMAEHVEALESTVDELRQRHDEIIIKPLPEPTNWIDPVKHEEGLSKEELLPSDQALIIECAVCHKTLRTISALRGICEVMRIVQNQPNLTPKSIYNPSKEDFTITYADETNNPVPYTLHAGEIETFPTYIANHISKHLAHKLVGTRGIKANYEDDIKAMLAQIETDL